MQTTKSDADAVAYIPGPKVRARYNVTDMTIHRWLNDEGMGFPRPFYFGRFRYWLLAELEAWERAQPRARYSKANQGEAARPMADEHAVGTPSGCLLNPAEARPIDGPAEPSRPGACRRALSEKGRAL